MLHVETVPASEMMRIQASAKSNPAGENPISFAAMHRAAMTEVTEDSRSQWFRQEMYQQLDKVQTDRSVAGFAVEITAEGMRAMEASPEYRKQVMDLIRKDVGSSYAPRQAKLHFRVGSNLDEYQVHSWSAADDAEFREVSANSFYKRGNSSGHIQSYTGVAPTAFQVFRSHLQMQLEKLDNGPARVAGRPRQQSTSIYDSMGYVDPEIRDYRG